MSESLKSKAIKGVIWKTINTLTNLSVAFVVGIILARRLSPSDYGAVAMIGVFTSVLGVFTDGGLSAALIRKENRTEDDKCTIFYYNFVASYLIYSIIYISAPYIASFYNMPILCKLARISSLGLLISPFASMQAIHFTISLDFKTPAYIGIVCNMFNASIALWMAYNDYGVWSLAIPGVITTALNVIIVISIVRWKPTKRFSIASFKKLFAFSSNLLFSMLLGRVYSNITPLIIGKFFTPAQLGLYEKAKGWPGLPSSTFTEVLQGVTFPVMSKMQSDINRLATNYRSMVKFYTFIIFPMMFGLAAVAKPLTIVLVTEKWIDSVLLMQLICFSLMWYPIHSLTNNVLHVLGRSDYFLKVEIMHKIVSLALMACSLPFGLVTFCAVSIFTSMISLYIVTSYVKKLINIGFLDIIKDIFPTISACAVMFFICLAIQQVMSSYGTQLAICIPVAIAYYVVVARHFNKEQFNEAIDILADKYPVIKRFKVS